MTSSIVTRVAEGIKGSILDPFDYTRAFRSFAYEKLAERKLSFPELGPLLAESYASVNRTRGWSKYDKEYARNLIARSVGAIFLYASKVSAKNGRKIAKEDIDLAIKKMYGRWFEEFGGIWTQHLSKELYNLVGLDIESFVKRH